MTNASSEPSTPTFPRTIQPNPLSLGTSAGPVILPFETIPETRRARKAVAKLRPKSAEPESRRTPYVQPMNPSDPHKRLRLEDVLFNP